MAQEVILMEDVAGLGNTGDIVKVSPGYARNYLFPRNIAAVVTDSARRQVEKRRQVAEANRAQARQAAEALAAKLGTITCTITAKAGAEGKLYGSIGVNDVLEALKKQGVELQKHQLDLAEPFRQTGEYSVKVKLLPDLQAELKVAVKE